MKSCYQHKPDRFPGITFYVLSFMTLLRNLIFDLLSHASNHLLQGLMNSWINILKYSSLDILTSKSPSLISNTILMPPLKFWIKKPLSLLWDRLDQEFVINGISAHLMRLVFIWLHVYPGIKWLYLPQWLNKQWRWFIPARAGLCSHKRLIDRKGHIRLLPQLAILGSSSTLPQNGHGWPLLFQRGKQSRSQSNMGHDF